MIRINNPIYLITTRIPIQSLNIICLNSYRTRKPLDLLETHLDVPSQTSRRDTTHYATASPW